MNHQSLIPRAFHESRALCRVLLLGLHFAALAASLTAPLSAQDAAEALAPRLAPVFVPDRPPADPDPTRANPEMEEVLRALRQSGQTQGAKGTQPGAAAIVKTPLELAGWVVPHLAASGTGEVRTASAIVRLGDTLTLAQPRQNIVSGGWNLSVVEVSATRVLVSDGGKEIVLASETVERASSMQETLEVVEFRDVPLSLAARALSDATGIRMAVSAEAREIPVSLYLRAVSGDEVIDSLVLTHGLYLSRVEGANIVRIHTGEEYARDANSFLDERTQVFNLKFPNARDVAVSIRDLFGDRVRLSSRLDDEEEPGEHLTQDLQQRMERFDVIDARGQGFGVDTGGSNQGGAASNQRSNRSLTSRNQSNTRSFGRGGVEQGAGEVETDRISLDENFTAEEIAALEVGDPAAIAQFVQSRADIHVTVIERLNKVMVRTRDEKTMQEICELVKSIDVPTPLVLLEVKIMEVGLERGLDSAFDWSFQAGNVAGSFAPGGPSTNGDLVFTFLSDSFRAQIDLLQRGNKITMLGKPMLLTANNEVSRLFIGEEVPLNRNFQGGQTVITDGSPSLPRVTLTSSSARSARPCSSRPTSTKTELFPFAFCRRSRESSPAGPIFSCPRPGEDSPINPSTPSLPRPRAVRSSPATARLSPSEV